MLCPICNEDTTEAMINHHLDRGCPKKRKLEPISPGSESQQLPGSGQASRQPSQASPKPSQSRGRAASGSTQPLAESVRPKTLEQYVGQSHLVGPNGVLRHLIARDRVPSILLWGPSGVGKTTFARLISHVSKSRFVQLSATSASVADVKAVIEEARKTFALLRQRTILFLDEIHRFNRGQQDTLLPSVEKGEITLVGATTENPSFKLQGALLSRCQVFTLKALTSEEILKVLENALATVDRTADPAVLKHISEHCNGDARVALNMLEIAIHLPEETPLEDTKMALRTLANYDQKGENHYDFISAFHKSVRGSDPDAAMYYLARMLRGGEDPLYVSRHMIRIASEDIGLADDTCLPFAVATHNSVQQVGMPECDVMLAHCAVKLARAPKDVEVYKAWKMLAANLEQDQTLAEAPIPMHLRNAPTKLMDDLGYGDGYKYNPAFIGEVNQAYLPSGTERWLGKYQPTRCDDCGIDNGECEHFGGEFLRDFE